MAGAKVPLDWRRVAASTAGQTIGRRLVYLPETGSTNDVGLALAAQGEPEGTVVFADKQTAGRGRAGKSPWLSPPGAAIALSVLLRPLLAPVELPWIAMAAGVAAAEAIRAITRLPVRLKWPNDLLIGEKKTGGILVESSIAGGRVAAAILGIGINCNFPASALGALPDAAVPPTTLQDELGFPVEREALLADLLRALDERYAAVRRRDWTVIRSTYRQALSTIGRSVRVSRSTSGAAEAEAIEGVAEDLGADGALIVRLPSGERQAFHYGEVSVR